MIFVGLYNIVMGESLVIKRINNKNLNIKFEKFVAYPKIKLWL